MFTILMTLLFLISPALIATSIHFHNVPGRPSKFQWAEYAVIYLFLITFLNCAAMYLRGHASAEFIVFFRDVNGLFKIGALSLVLSVILPHVVLYAISFWNTLPERLEKAMKEAEKSEDEDDGEEEEEEEEDDEEESLLLAGKEEEKEEEKVRE